MTNIRFTYLYRDGSNYKNWAEVIFSNPTRLSITEISGRLSFAFLEDGHFIADQIHLPEVFLTQEFGLAVDDHCYHEFDSIEKTTVAPSDPLGRSIKRFLSEVEMEARRGWQAFNQEDRQKEALH